ncbi:MAG: carbohydrate ABC transporter permease [Treponema sp.]|jgi:multiple sugar transport system permease protein|nr:carbohydrate ABC transporter permease [Treponema sp.]
MSNVSFIRFRRNALKGAGSIAYKICRALLIIGLCFLIIQPLLSKITTSLMTRDDAYDPTVINVPKHFTLSNYPAIAKRMDYFPVMGRTFLVVFSATALQIAACLLAGYSFGRFQYPLKKALFFLVIIIIVVPPQTIMAPLYLNFRYFDVLGIFRLLTGEPLNLLGSPASYLVLHATGLGLKSGLYIFLLRQYFRGVPRELEEAAYVDGCGRMRTFGQILLPDALPMVTACFLFSFVWQWTDSFYFNLFMPAVNMMSSALAGLTGGAEGLRTYDPYAQGQIYTGILLTLAPMVLIYLFAQKTFVASLAHTGIKM